MKTGTFSSQARRSSVRREDLRVTLSGHYRLREVPGMAFSGFSEDGLNQAQRDPNQAVRITEREGFLASLKLAAKAP
eukprot:symbB.v1.2.011783.t1/scaffold798.1/size257095/4